MQDIPIPQSKKPSNPYYGRQSKQYPLIIRLHSEGYTSHEIRRKVWNKMRVARSVGAIVKTARSSEEKKS